MAISGFLFILWRIVELITLIPPIGMLSYFIHGYIAANELTPNFILVLFIVVVLAGVWVLATLLFYFRARHAGLFVAIIDLGFFAALIAGVVVLNGINAQSCSNFNPSSYIGVSLGPFAYDLGNACGLLKASYAFAIMNIIFFFITFVLALLVARHHQREDQGTREKTTTTRRSHRHSSRSGGSRQGSRSGDSRYGGSRVGGDGRRDYRNYPPRRDEPRRDYSRQRSNV